MSARKLTLLAMGVAAIVSAAFMPKLVFSAQERAQLGALNVSEGIYIDRKSFDIIKGTAKVDPTADLMKAWGERSEEWSHRRSSPREALPLRRRSRSQELVHWLGGGCVWTRAGRKQFAD